MSVAMPLLDVRGLTKEFDVTGGIVARLRAGRRIARAVTDVSLSIPAGETLGLVGESGSGKTTVGKTVVRLYDPDAGRILFEGQDLAVLSRAAVRPYRRRMQMVFQDPESSLNRRKTVEQILSLPLSVHRLARGRARRERVERALEQVGLNPAFRRRFPHEFSGGQRQRIGIARALITEPSLVVADEPVSALDVSTQAQVINLLTHLQQDLGLSFLFISHDLSVVKHISRRLAVMYLGEIVEAGPSQRVFESPAHPYTRALLTAVPVLHPTSGRKRIILAGEVPGPVDPPSGCRFHTRCPAYIGDICRDQVPLPRDLGGGQVVRCHLYDELPLAAEGGDGTVVTAEPAPK
jgi:oligopeptide/dipeptide ABC transporter ATP-binding protein